MNISSSALILRKASQVLPSEKDLPSLPSIDLHKKRKQPKPGISLPPDASSTFSVQQRRRQSRASPLEKEGGWRENLYPSHPQEESKKKTASLPGQKRKEEEGKRRKNHTAALSSRPSGSVPGADSPWLSKLTKSSSKAATATATTTADSISHATGELTELLALCQKIETDCLQQEQQQEDKQKQGEDEFDATKRRIEEILHNTRILIQARQDIRAKKGTTLESVRLGGEIHDNITLLKELFHQLAGAYNRLFKLRKKLQLSDEELEQRHAEVCKLMRCIEDIRRDYQRSAVGLSKGSGIRGGEGGGIHSLAGYKTLTQLQQEDHGDDIRKGEIDEREGKERRNYKGNDGIWGIETSVAAQDSKSALRGQSVGRKEERISEEDMAVVKRWKQRDAEFDQQVQEIGNAIDRIANVTAQIGEKADVQRELIQKVQQETDKTTAELQHVTEKVKEVLGTQSNMRFFTRLILIVILLFLICFVLSVIYSRYIKH